MQGVNACLKRVGDLFRAIPDAHAYIEALIAEENPAAVRWTISGTRADIGIVDYLDLSLSPVPSAIRIDILPLFTA